VGTPVRIEDFDAYDRFVLWTALTSGFRYVEVRKGPHGYWVADSLPTGRSGTSHLESIQLVRLDEIDGLTAASRQRYVEAGPWLQFFGTRFLSLDRLAMECTTE
jgi:hypothetical protein